MELGASLSIISAVAIALGATLAGCTPVDEPLGAKAEEIVSNLLQAGHEREDIEVLTDGTVLLEGDIEVDLEASRERSPSRFRQYRTTDYVTLPANSIICVDTSRFSPGLWGLRGALETAITRWNALGLRFTLVATQTPSTSNCTATITIELENDTSRAFATWPSGGMPGPRITIGKDNADYLCSAREFVVATFMHEIGHTLGLRHSNWQERGEGTIPEGQVHIPGTPEAAPPDLSVMNSPIAIDEPTSQFTASDREAIRHLWGA